MRSITTRTQNIRRCPMLIDLWINEEGRDEIRRLGSFGWFWLESDALRAGPGPGFGNSDSKGLTLAIRQNGVWVTSDGKTWTDVDIQKEPELTGVEKLAECVGYLTFSPQEVGILKKICDGTISVSRLFEGGDYTLHFRNGLSEEEMDAFLQKLE